MPSCLTCANMHQCTWRVHVELPGDSTNAKIRTLASSTRLRATFEVVDGPDAQRAMGVLEWAWGPLRALPLGPS
eukprot:1014748-Pyramimonas_sp.AAC.1